MNAPLSHGEEEEEEEEEYKKKLSDMNAPTMHALEFLLTADRILSNSLLPFLSSPFLPSSLVFSPPAHVP
jgi:hypothetical protein